VGLRISGLVKIFNEVRAELVVGIPENKQPDFCRKVESVIKQVEQICRRHRKTPDALPAPSRNAYHFLKNLDLENLPKPNDSQQTLPLASPQRISGLLSTAHTLSDKIWRNALLYSRDPQQYSLMRDEIQKKFSQFKTRIGKFGVSPFRLSQPSRNAYCWLGFLAVENNLRQHLRAVHQIQIVLSHHFGKDYLNLIEVQFVYTNYIYRFRKEKNKVVLRCNEALIEAGNSVWLEIFQRVFNGEKSQVSLEAYLHSGRYQHISRQIEAFAAGSFQTRGQYFDLREVFERVNNDYFKGEMLCPQLHWNQTLTSGKLGHYHVLRDELMVSVTLDHPNVPAYVMDYVMYHELLHKKHGVRRKNGRTIGHFKAFREDEKRFPKYREANEFIKIFLARQRKQTKQNNGAFLKWIKRKYT
jgi:hypothetical protein